MKPSIDKTIIDKTNAWPFVEAKKILKERKQYIEKKKKIILQTGYGPSGLPHIGTFGEVARTTMVVNALNQMTDIPKEIITFSDDMDGLRKVPDNIPNKDLLENNLNKPLTKVPDPFNKFKSFGEHNNEMLKNFLNQFKFKYSFKSSTDLYTSGQFNDTLKLVLENYKGIMDIIIPTLGKERQKTYSPFLPICPETEKVLEIPVIEIDVKNSKIIFNNNGKKLEKSILNGECKLQWKVDWAMRWYALDVDFEMYGKDLIESAILSSKIIKILGKTNPSGFAYELFLDEKGEKISKSKGNGLSIEEWLEYGSSNSLSLFMYNNPGRAKRLYFDCIPKNMDDYRKLFNSIQNQDDTKKLENPLWHIHQKKIPTSTYPIDFTNLLNLVTALNTTSTKTIKDFVKIYVKTDININAEKELDNIIALSIQYYKKFILPNIKKRKPNVNENKAIKKLAAEIKTLQDPVSAEDYQNIVYKIGKELFPDDLRKWFKSLYQILFGADSGPRLGSFFSVYGKKNVISLLEEAVN